MKTFSHRDDYIIWKGYSGVQVIDAGKKFISLITELSGIVNDARIWIEA